MHGWSRGEEDRYWERTKKSWRSSSRFYPEILNANSIILILHSLSGSIFERDVLWRFLHPGSVLCVQEKTFMEQLLWGMFTLPGPELLIVSEVCRSSTYIIEVSLLACMEEFGDLLWTQSAPNSTWARSMDFVMWVKLRCPSVYWHKRKGEEHERISSRQTHEAPHNILVIWV